MKPSLLDIGFLAATASAVQVPIASTDFDAFWKLEEATNTDAWTDELATYDLSLFTGTMDSATAKVNNGRKIATDGFGNPSGYFRSSSSLFNYGNANATSFCGWFLSDDANGVLLEFVGGGQTSRISFTNTAVRFGHATSPAVSQSITSRTGIWTFFACGCIDNGGTNVDLWISVNGKAKTWSTNLAYGQTSSFTENWSAAGTNIGASKYVIFDEFGVIKRELSQGEIAYIYNRKLGRDI